MRLQLLACALSTEESDEWDCGWCCVVNKERHHPHATSTVVARREVAPFGLGTKETEVGEPVLALTKPPVSIGPFPSIPSPHGRRPRTPRSEGNWATHSFFPAWSCSSTINRFAPTSLTCLEAARDLSVVDRHAAN